MSFDVAELGKTLRNDTFAMWFGWTLIIAIVIFPGTALIGSCWSDSVREDIELAKLRAESGDDGTLRLETMKWMVTRGIHPLVARCAVREGDSQTCNSLISDLEEEERATITAMLANPFIEVDASTSAITGLVETPVRSEYYVRGLDFGLRSPTE